MQSREHKCLCSGSQVAREITSGKHFSRVGLLAVGHKFLEKSQVVYTLGWTVLAIFLLGLWSL